MTARQKIKTAERLEAAAKALRAEARAMAKPKKRAMPARKSSARNSRRR